MAHKSKSRHIVIIGGGVSGVCCASECERILNCPKLNQHLSPLKNESEEDEDENDNEDGVTITLISLSQSLSVSTSLNSDNDDLDLDPDVLSSAEVTVDLLTSHQWSKLHPNVKIVHGVVCGVDLDDVTQSGKVHVLLSSSTSTSTSTKPIAIPFTDLCISVGASPTYGPIPSSFVHPQSSPKVMPQQQLVYTIRDASSIASLRALHSSPETTSIAIIGNGGIAMEVANALTTAATTTTTAAPLIEWIVRDRFVGHALLDATAAAFLMPMLGKRMAVDGGGDDVVKVNANANANANVNANVNAKVEKDNNHDTKRRKIHGVIDDKKGIGSSLGPNWIKHWDKTSSSSVRDQETLPITSVPVAASPFTKASCPCHSCKRGAFVLPPGGFCQVATDVGVGINSDKVKTPQALECSKLNLKYETTVLAIRTIYSTTWTVAEELNVAQTKSANEFIISQQQSSKPLENKVELYLSDGSILGCSAVVVATGVSPEYSIDSVLGPSSTPLFLRSKSTTKALIIDSSMRCLNQSNEPYSHIYAAGDCTDASSFAGDNELWHQIPLWTQARMSGVYAARCLLNVSDETGGDLSCGFELFTHRTMFLGKRVVLLGLYNGQKIMEEEGERLNGFVVDLKGRGVVKDRGRRWNDVVRKGYEGEDIELLVKDDGNYYDEDNTAVPITKQSFKIGDNIRVLARVSPDEYIKVIVCGGRVVGCMIVGDSLLEETMENLMMSRINVDALGFDLLDDDIDIEDYFD